MTVKFLIPLLFLSLLISCNTSKKIVNAENPEALAIEEALANIKEKNISFQRFNSKANLDINTSFFNGSANAKFRLVKDSVIWVSVTKLGFEAARILITPDSLFAVERIQKTFIKSTLAEISSQIGFTIDFDFIEDFILGNPYLDKNENEIKLNNRDTINVFPLMEEIFIHHQFSSLDYKLRKTDIIDDGNKVNATLQYNDYQDINPDDKFSHERIIRVNAEGEEENELGIKFSKPEIDVYKSIKFEIPSAYTVRNF